MLFGQKADEKRQDNARLAESAADAALSALAMNDLDGARRSLNDVPRKVAFSSTGWKVELVTALVEIAKDKPKAATRRLTEICSRLDETALSRDDKGYLRLFALYRAIDVSKTGRAPDELRMHADNFRFDHTLVSSDLRTQFPLKKTRVNDPAPPPRSAPVGSGDDGFGSF